MNVRLTLNRIFELSIRDSAAVEAAEEKRFPRLAAVSPNHSCRSNLRLLISVEFHCRTQRLKGISTLDSTDFFYLLHFNFLLEPQLLNKNVSRDALCVPSLANQSASSELAANRPLTHEGLRFPRQAMTSGATVQHADAFFLDLKLERRSERITVCLHQNQLFDELCSFFSLLPVSFLPSLPPLFPAFAPSSSFLTSCVPSYCLSFLTLVTDLSFILFSPSLPSSSFLASIPPSFLSSVFLPFSRVYFCSFLLSFLLCVLLCIPFPSHLPFSYPPSFPSSYLLAFHLFHSFLPTAFCFSFLCHPLSPFLPSYLSSTFLPFPPFFIFLYSCLHSWCLSFPPFIFPFIIYLLHFLMLFFCSLSSFILHSLIFLPSHLSA